ncbi:glutamine--tRNA ligase/YqeY domain fusion protein [Bianquea renquensis]|uniref:Glutamine--tRNA ligase n=1 Tax=Bianquea renquensis TaxID=2763661 RepID=A0A926DQY3_9FIRM|nr:glutamine--tRNA ligase/YqeY domain fusion protein [Bianquea renquensis]MBC8542169.1 glutamine--tRNA ligase/YqeY domain fusion protein [Bianquea renquensis]
MAEEKKLSLPEAENFIEREINRDLSEGVYAQVCTRFPPEPNGYMHIGHIKAICIDFGTAQKYGGKCNLRFDDTNPAKEDTEYVDSIMEDIRWMGFQWDKLFYASEYYDKLYEFAEILIKKGVAYVDDLSQEEMRQYRGTLTEPGKNSPYRDRSVEENLDLFRRMRAGEYKEGEKVLRAKIDMASPNMNMRDPAIYRIAFAHHHRTGDSWCIYPMYDFAHPLSDAIEGITHSLCSFEFEDHRPLYNWFIEQVGLFPTPPRQIEFSRMEITNVVTSKRKLRALVEDGVVEGWDDPRMPTLAGLRKRGYTPESIKTFITSTGVSKSRGATIDYSYLEYCIREDLKMGNKRLMAVLDPIKVVITNYPEGRVEYFDVDNNPENPELGTRKIPFERELYIERGDFMEEPEKKFFRLAPGREVRFMNSYFITCQEVVKDERGEIVELRCTYDPETRSGSGFTGRKVKGTIHWVSANAAVRAKVRLYDQLFSYNEETKEYEINANSLAIQENALIEPSILEEPLGSRFQFVRNGYFITDPQESTEDSLVINRIVALKSSYKPVEA